MLPIFQNQALFSILRTTYGGDGRTTFALPELRGRTAIHAGTGPGLTSRPLGQKTGVENVTLTVDQMPSHSHTLPSGDTYKTGGGQPHTNMQPSLALNRIIALSGLFPSRNLTSGDTPISALGGLEPFIGGVSLFAGNFAPRGWALTDGRLLDISQNTALFSLLGTTYGGDGRTTFALPDLRWRVPIHPGAGPGLTPGQLGQTIGVEELALTVNQLPAHEHVVPEPATLSLLFVGGGVALLRRRR